MPKQALHSLTIVAYILNALMTLVPFINLYSIFNGDTNGSYYYFSAISCIVIWLYLVQIFCLKTAYTSINKYIITGGVVISYINARVMFDELSYISTPQLITVNLIFLYFLSICFFYQKTNTKYKFYFLNLLIVTSLIESILVILQTLKVFPITFFSNNWGTFSNSGILGSFLAIGIISGLGMLLRFDNSVRASIVYKCFLYGSIITSLTGILLTEARAAWLATLISCIGLSSGYLRKYKKEHLKTFWITILSVFLLFIVIENKKVFSYKLNSAIGRVLIYKVSSNIIKDNFIWGVGLSRFKAEYNNYQAKYFAVNPNSKYSYLADNTRVAFNEFLQIWAELGLPGLVLVIFFLLIIMKSKPREGQSFIHYSAKWAFTSLLISALFSYPFQIFPIAIYGILLVCMIISSSSYDQIKISVTKLSSIVFTILVSFFLIWNLTSCYKDYLGRTIWKDAERYASLTEESESLPLYKAAYGYLKYDPFFLYNYGAEVAKNNPAKSNQILFEAMHLLSDNNLCSLIGDNFYNLNKLNEAKKYYLLSIYMVPHKLYARYRLFALYNKEKNTKAAHVLAQEIARMNIKVPSETTDFIKQEINNYLKNKMK